VRGIMTFSGVYTNNPASSTGTGIGAADLLLGAPISGNISILEGARGFRRTELGFHTEDDWKFSSRLTLNLGVRYELYLGYPWTEVGDRGEFFDLKNASLIQVGTNGIPRTGAGLNALDLNLLMSYVQQWNMSLQYQLTGNILWQTAYVGTKGVKLRDQINANQPTPGPGAVATRRPYPAYADIQLTAFLANSIFHSLQITLDKRFGNGLGFPTSYTWGHAINDADVFGGGHLDVNNLRADRGNAPFDRRHMLLASYNYAFPFASKATGLKKFLLSGWQTNGVLRLMTLNPACYADR
jgi:hypothetical protein